MEIVNTIPITLDFRKPSKIPMPQVNQYDTNEFEFTVLENGSPADLSTADRIVANYRRPDKNVITREITAVDNVITYPMGAEEMAVEGLGELNVQLFKEGRRLSSMTIKVYVYRNLGAAFEGGEGLPLLQDLFVEVSGLVEDTQTNATYALNQGDYAKEQADAAAAELASLSQVKADAESATDSANTAAGLANTNAVDAETQAAYAKEQGDYANAEYLRLKDTDVSTLSAQLADIAYNVKSYGAKGDGITNDTTVLQNLINTVSSQGGGSIFFPKGIYVAYLQLPSNIRLVGVGYDSCIKLPAGFKYAVPVIINKDHTNGNKNITIENIRVDGNKSGLAADAVKDTGQPWEGIDIILGTDLRFKNVWIENCENEGLDLDGGENILIDGLYVSNCGGSPLHPSNGQGAYSSKNVIIRNVWSKNNGHTYSRSVFIYGSNDVVFDGFFSDGDYMGLQILAEKVKANNISIKNSVNRGILVSGASKDIQFSNVSIINAGGEGLVIADQTTEKNISLINVSVKGSVLNNYSLAGKKIQMDNCVSISSGSIGVFLQGSDFDLANVKSIGSTGRGVQIEASGVRINGLAVKEGSTHGVNIFNSSNLVLSGSEISANQGFGITLNGTANNYGIVGNNLTSNTSGAMYGSRSGHFVSNNLGLDTIVNRQKGVATVNAGTDKITVTHNVGYLPPFIDITMTTLSEVQKYIVEARTATTFDIRVSPTPTVNTSFLWMAE
ncbi:hypothetical protein KYJ26_16620 [Bacillus sp. MCCB 382]|uniref:glycosyl hydrolase family 28-related protein n=1 Tax=Bacillus sp. MCCB 382 TaxID=2860197 RepID=UPI001C55D5C9|nr:hypothetical protein [Bacillus sp. MCCB 382]